jgi:hypothetical protein
MTGCVFRAGCVSNRGRQHFELIWFEAYDGSGLMVARGLRWLGFVLEHYEAFARD